MDLIIGRFQPVTIAHYRVISEMKEPVIVFVNGKLSQKDKKRNPFSIEDRYRFLRSCFPNAQIFPSDNGYAPEIVSWLEYHGFPIDTIYAGGDRINGYVSQFSREKNYNKDIEYIEIPRDDVSATKFRELVRVGDLEEAKKLIPEELYGEFEYMTDKIQEEPTNATGGVATSPKPMNPPKKVKTFKEFIDDEDKQSEEE